MKTLIISLTLLMAACGSNSNLEYLGDVSSDFEAIREIPASGQPELNATQSTAIDQKVIKKGSIDFESENVEEDYQKIKTLLPGYKAYLESENQNKSESYIRYYLTVRVPSDKYDSLFTTINDLAYKLESKRSSVEDVTARYYDLQSRIDNQKALEQRYLDLLKKTTTIKDILEIERSLTEIRTKIEQLEGQFKYLSKQISYSTLEITFYEQLPYVYNETGRKGFFARILSSLSTGWSGFLTFLVGVVSLWPFIILLIVLIILFRKWRKKRKLRKLQDQ